MIVISATAFGALLGTLVARQRGGTRLDMAHHAAVFAILFAVAGMIVTIAIVRMA